MSSPGKVRIKRLPNDNLTGLILSFAGQDLVTYIAFVLVTPNRVITIPTALLAWVTSAIKPAHDDTFLVPLAPILTELDTSPTTMT